MAKYYYDKYNVSTSYGSQSSWPWISEGKSYHTSTLTLNMYLSTSSSGFSVSDSKFWYQNSNYSDPAKYSSENLSDSGTVAIPGVSTGYGENGSNYLRKYVYSGVEFSSYYNKYTFMFDIYTIQFSALTPIYGMGTLYQSNIQAENGTYPANGRHSDGYWYVRKSAVNTAPTMPGAFTQPSGTVVNTGENITVSWGASTDTDGNAITYYPEYRYYKSGVAQTWATLVSNNGITRNLTITSDKTLDKIEFRVRAFDGTEYSAYRNSTVFTIHHNALPTLNLNTADNQTLYENSTLNISGTAIDADIGNVVSVKFKVNNGTSRTIDAKVMDGTALAFDRTLIFKQGILYDGATAITGALQEGVPNTFTVWSEDDQGGKSADVTRAFLVVSNRAPSLLVNPIATKSNLINKDAITIGGSVTDPENDNVTVSYKLNGASSIQVYNGAPGVWTFDLLLKNLQKGDNAVVIEAVDSYGAKATKTLKVSKTHNAVPLKKASAMWKINSATTTTKEVLAWIQRELGDLEIDAEISMTNAGEVEDFVPMDLTNTGPIGDTIIEDEFYFLAPVAKENIVLKLNLSRSDTSSQEAIKLISGVLE